MSSVTLRVEDQYDRRVWDDLVSSRPSGHFMQSWAWGQFQRELGWEPRYCLLSDGDEIRAAVLVLARDVPGIGARIYHVPRGPALDPSDSVTLDALLTELDRFMAAEGGVLMRFDPYWTEEETKSPPLPERLQRVPRDWSDWNAPRLVFWLDLEGDEEAVMMRATSRCRNDIRRGYRNDVVFEPGGVDDLDEFYRLMVMTGQEKGIAFHGPDYYRKLYERVNESARVQLFFGRYEGEAVTTGMSVVYGKTAWLLYAATSPDHYKLRATRTQQWEMIKWAHGLGCQRYDFRGTATGDPPSEDDPGYGVYKFKQSFGPEFTRLTGYYDLVRRPLLYRAFRMTEDHLLPVAYRVKTWMQ